MTGEHRSNVYFFEERRKQRLHPDDSLDVSVWVVRDGETVFGGAIVPFGRLMAWFDFLFRTKKSWRVLCFETPTLPDSSIAATKYFPEYFLPTVDEEWASREQANGRALQLATFYMNTCKIEVDPAHNPYTLGAKSFLSTGSVMAVACLAVFFYLVIDIVHPVAPSQSVATFICSAIVGIVTLAVARLAWSVRQRMSAMRNPFNLASANDSTC